MIDRFPDKIFLPLRPEIAARLLNEKPDAILMKTRPLRIYPYEVFVYVSESGDPLEFIPGHGWSLLCYRDPSYQPDDARGKVIAKFWLWNIYEGVTWLKAKSHPWIDTLVAFEEKDSMDVEKPLFGWRVSGLEVLPEPLPLSALGFEKKPRRWVYVREGAER